MVGRFTAACFGTMLICDSAFAFGRIATERVRGWQIETDRQAKACTAVGPVHGNGNRLSFRWDLGARDWIIGVSNHNWVLDEGRTIGARIFVDRRYLTADRLRVRTRNEVTLRVPKGETRSNREIYGALAAGRTMAIRWSGGGTTRVSLAGTFAALMRMDRCVAQIQRGQHETIVPPRPKPVSWAVKYAKLDIPRERSVKFLKQLFNEKKRQITFVPPSIKKFDFDVVRYRFNNGDLGWFRAHSTSSPDADRYASDLIAQRLEQCAGRFVNEIEKIPSTDGRLIRGVNTGCIDGDKMKATITTVIRYPDGLLLEINRSSEGAKTSPEKEWEKSIPTETVHAAVSFIK